jgi:hypothetical protein
MSDKPLYILGVDLGQAQDFTALSVLERTGRDTGKRVAWGVPGPINWDDDTPPTPMPTSPVNEHHYAARHLERLPIGTPYPAQVARVKALHDHLKAQEGTAPLLVVDQTGVGRPVVDMLRAAELSPAAVTITGGDAVSRDGGDYRCPSATW